jgi:hypothetical protein
MSTSEHPITPPSELIRELWDKHRKAPDAGIDAATAWRQVITLAAQWGADMELEACCEYLVRCAQWEPEDVAELRAARRPKPPSLKEEALQALNEMQIEPCFIDGIDVNAVVRAKYNKIRRAIEALPND